MQPALRLLAVAFALSIFFQAAGSRGQEEKLDAEVQQRRATERLLRRAEDEYRNHLAKPTRPLEFWAAMKYEISLGKFDLAALHMKLLLELEPKEQTDRDLVRIEEVDGITSFLRLRDIKVWSEYPPFQEEAVKNTEILIGRVTRALDRYLSDPARIQKFIKQLNASTPEERAFAFVQLDRTKERAVPYYLEALQRGPADPLYRRVVDLMLRAHPDTVPAYLEVLKADNPDDARNIDLRLVLLDILRQRGDRRALPYLWHLSSSELYPQIVRSAARRYLAELQGVAVTNLPSAKVVLTQMAESYYKHQVRFPEGRPIRLWNWNGKRLSTEPIELTPHQAEEFFGKRYAREALELDPAYTPAQNVLLCLTLDRAFENQIDQVVLRPLPLDIRQLLSTIDVELLTQVMDRGLEENNPAVSLPALIVLGERGEFGSPRTSDEARPRGLVRALFYPDRRVQFAAMRALLRMPGEPTALVAHRIVDDARRFVLLSETPKALFAYVPPEALPKLRQAFRDVGYEADAAADVRKAFELVRNSSDYDLIVLHQAIGLDQLPFVLGQFRSDSDTGRLPIFLVASKEHKEAAERVARRFGNTVVLPELLLHSNDELKAEVDRQLQRAFRVNLSAAERKEFAKFSLDVLWRLARGEMVGYDVRLARDAVFASLRSPELAPIALDIMAKLPGADVQQRLAALVLDPSAGKQRPLAAFELNRHIDRYGLLLSPMQLDAFREAHLAGKEDPEVRAQIAIVVGRLPTTARQTGAQLLNFRPAPPPAPAPAEEEKK